MARLRLKTWAFSLIISGCDYSHQPVRETEPTAKPTRSKATEVAELNQSLLAIAEDQEVCQRERRSCPKTGLNDESNTLSRGKAKGPVILVYDSGMTLTSLSLHKERVLAHYRYNESLAIFERYHPSITVPSAYAKATRILAQKPWAIGPIPELAAAKLRLAQSLESGWQLGLTKHGDVIFNLLAELNPDASFVLVSTNPSLDKTLCQLKDPEVLKQRNAAFSAEGRALALLANEWQVDYLNISGGYTGYDAKHDYAKQGCEARFGAFGDEDFAKAAISAASFFSALAEEVKGVVVQAGPNIDLTEMRPLAKDDPFYYGDCLTLKNRLRIQAKLQAASASDDVTTDCTDLSIVMRAEDDDPLAIRNTTTGLRYYVSGAMTSWTAPLAISYLLWQREHGGATKGVIDPSRHGQFIRPQPSARFKIGPATRKTSRE